MCAYVRRFKNSSELPLMVVCWSMIVIVWCVVGLRAKTHQLVLHNHLSDSIVIQILFVCDVRLSSSPVHSQSLDNLPLTDPEHFGAPAILVSGCGPVLVGVAFNLMCPNWCLLILSLSSSFSSPRSPEGELPGQTTPRQQSTETMRKRRKEMGRGKVAPTLPSFRSGRRSSWRTTGGGQAGYLLW